MREYRRLSPKDRKKLKFVRFIKNVTKSTTKWSVATVLILVFLIVGIVFFYKVVDNKNTDDNSEYSEASKTMSTESDDVDLTESEKKELEIDSQKENDNVNESDKQEILKKETQSNIDSQKKSENKGENNKQNTTESKTDGNYDFSKWNESCPRELIVTNKSNPIPEKYKVNTKLCRGKEIDSVVCEHLEQMIVDARKNDIILWISSGYRSVELQSKLFNNQVAREKNKSVITDEEAKKRAQTVVAYPGTSEHNTGLAVDFNGVQDDFYTKKEYKWLMDNAHKYGFIERYQKKWQDKTGVIYEPWHFRYVGAEKASTIKDSGLCLEEYVYKNLM